MSYLSLEEAAAKLGISTDRLVEIRSQGQIRGFRDGSSWKFPETEIDRLADDLAAEGAGSGIMVNESDLGDAGGIGSVIGGDGADDGEGSDVNLVPSEKEGSDTELVASKGEKADEVDVESLFEINDGELQEIDSGELNLNDPAMLGDSSESIDIAIDPKEGSTGPVPRKEIEAEADKISISDVDAVGEDSLDESAEKDFAFSGDLSDEDSDDLMLGEDSESLDLDALSDEPVVKSAGASNLELMGDLDAPSTDKPIKSSSGADVLSELDLLGAEQSGSGLISGDSENLLTSSGLGSGLGSSVSSELDDALDEDDDLVIAEDDAELMLDSVSDISVAGDSGINLMSPSDSGLSLESEPLDLAGSSLSALDLGAELADGSGIGSGISSGSSGKLSVESSDASDEEFQLSPSGVGIDGDLESSSQVIEVEDSEVVDLQGEFSDDAGFAEVDEPLGADVFEEAPVAGAIDGDPMGADPMGGDIVELDEVEDSPVAAVGGGYEIPFTLMQCLSLMFIVLALSLCGMLMTDLVRNMWAYSETSAPVSGITDSLIGLMGWDS